MKRRETGFTLIEIITALGIIAILVAIAYPNYMEYLVKTRRADAQGALMSLANAMERYYTQNNTYVGATLGNGGGDIFPAQAPIDGDKKYYNLSIIAPTGTSYTLRAAPIANGGQSADGLLELDSTGARRWNKQNLGVFVDWDGN